MNFSITYNQKDSAEMTATFRTADIYRKTFLSDMIKDMARFTSDDTNVSWNDEDINKLFGIIWAHIKCRNKETPEFEDWKKTLKNIKAIEAVKKISELWMTLSVPTIEQDEINSAPSRDDVEPSYLLYKYLARKLNISNDEFLEMTPGELMDIVWFELKMERESKDPTYKAAQNDYDEFFNY